MFGLESVLGGAAGYFLARMLITLAGAIARRTRNTTDDRVVARAREVVDEIAKHPEIVDALRRIILGESR